MKTVQTSYLLKQFVVIQSNTNTEFILTPSQLSSFQKYPLMKIKLFSYTLNSFHLYSNIILLSSNVISF